MHPNKKREEEGNKMVILEEIINYEFGLSAFIIGMVATVFTRYSSIPQIIKGFKTKKMEDVSFWLIFHLTVGLALWVVYGILIDDFVIIWANAIGVASNIILIGLKIKYSVKPFG
jgi:MtN3 and saliva related transmembrane protein